MTLSTEPHRILVIGGGAGGLELVTQLGHRYRKKPNITVTLVDQKRSHIWKPLLHEVATGSLDPSTDAVTYHAHAVKHHYEFQLGCFSDLDTESQTVTLSEKVDENGRVILPERYLKYDTLVLGIGSVSNDFKTPGVAEHCYFLDTAKQAERFHNSLINNFMRINQQDHGVLNIAIVGGGATGVELSAELHNVTDMLRSYGLPNMTAQQLKVTLIEAGPRILPALPERISNSARQELSDIGVQVAENTMIKSASPEGFTTSEGDLIEADMMIWAAGVKAPDFIADLYKFELTRTNQILVKPTLQSSLHDNIFVIGDCCACEQEDGSWVPPRAQSAHQMASLVKENIKLKLQGKPLKSFIYKDHGSLVNLSRYSTVGSLMGNLTKNSMFIEGKIARVVYISLYRMHQIAIHGFFKAMLVYIAEKVSKVVRPKMKLH
ncbi:MULTISPECIES: NAD(P)/FAD-dependent oxidoreductase [unclassified Neptuniibacter]|jgi:NADH dehydrogenase|uniref:NAD(P)/FAD-dependent oxidoreductase n=1 Tax=unclassified Neptuniibacter TaxID=2630693 RepID=UPI0026E20DFC|nr:MULTISPECIES: NAD(P)/FAD-dependent oxidoreductase [unclassified Neptuniibacter]MDO6514662.1 NAD(P)/FAD-dependent oxidoreductase [Neptuniibacter sp. 2_MG-2023]MDO6594946.1 NAD(P)/FAD-dependent oxidoreductase [Neptuniibacter sp. 1_MG-2023]